MLSNVENISELHILQSDCFYNGGWTEDIRNVINHIHCQYPEAPLYVVGTSIGANMLVYILVLYTFIRTDIDGIFL